eukprot:2861587-Alexandrium_andersonii.AAC.1
MKGNTCVQAAPRCSESRVRLASALRNPGAHIARQAARDAELHLPQLRVQLRDVVLCALLDAGAQAALGERQ